MPNYRAPFLSVNVPPGKSGRKPLPVKERILANVEVDEAGCWLWKGRIEWSGYTQIKFRGKMRATHRVAYAAWKGDIPEGMQIDHRCHNEDPSCIDGTSCRHRRCVNPDHLRATTNIVNTFASRNTLATINSRKTECSKGHPFDNVNTYVTPEGYRQCRECKRRTGRQRLSAQTGQPSFPRSKTHCRRGHPFDEVNTRIAANGQRLCRECCHIRGRSRYGRNQITEGALL